jgi:hypothetical protein
MTGRIAPIPLCLRVRIPAKMKRRPFNVKRRLLTVGRVVSLILCALCLILWFWSKMTPAAVWYESSRGRNWYAMTSSGDLILATFDTPGTLRLVNAGDFGWHFAPTSLGGRQPLGQQDGGSIHSRLGMASAITALPYPDHYNAGWGYQVLRAYARCIFIPYWLLIAIFAVAPIRWEREAHRETIRKRRRMAGLCAECGYDLRATKGRCPECGTAINGIKLITTPRPD